MEICIFYHNSPAASARAPPHRSTHIVFYISILHSEIRTHSPTHRFRACRGDRMENSLFLIQFSLLETKLIIIAYYVHCMRNTLNFLAHTHRHTTHNGAARIITLEYTTILFVIFLWSVFFLSGSHCFGDNSIRVDDVNELLGANE